MLLFGTVVVVLGRVVGNEVVDVAPTVTAIVPGDEFEEPQDASRTREIRAQAARGRRIRALYSCDSSTATFFVSLSGSRW
jgi:hypothetical protein